MFKDDCIKAIQNDFGWTKEKAEKYYNQIDEDMKQEIVKGFREQAKRSFLEDQGVLKMTDKEIQDFISTVVLSKITDYALQTALRRVLFYNKNKIDWKDFYNQIAYQMPELRMEV